MEDNQLHTGTNQSEPTQWYNSDKITSKYQVLMSGFILTLCKIGTAFIQLSHFRFRSREQRLLEV